MIDLKKMPKVELHLHLDGSVNLALLEEYYGRKLENEVTATEKCLNLSDYLNKFLLPIEYLQSKENITKACLFLSRDLENDGVIYAEVRFAPCKHSSILELEEVVESVINGFKKGNVLINVILCMMRNDSYQDNLKVIKLASKYLGKGVVAVDLAGDEAHYKTKEFESLFNILKEEGIPFTIHAGEIDDFNSIRDALDFGTKRLGHGINAFKYQELLDSIISKKVLLEVCPTSNIQTNVVSTYKNHPIKKLKESGCLISINTDNRTVSNITLTEEYQKLIKGFGFTIDDLTKFNLNAINYSYLSDSEKRKKCEEIVRYSKINL